MPPLVVNGGQIKCSFGDAPVPLTVLPAKQVTGANQPAANIMDHAPMVNIASFGMCKSPTNPLVITATAAAAGVLTPQPCVPVTTTPWSPGATKVTIKNMPALHKGCMCNCMWLGVITVSDPGQTVVEVT